jgi:hypothetical protein
MMLTAIIDDRAEIVFRRVVRGKGGDLESGIRESVIPVTSVHSQLQLDPNGALYDSPAPHVCGA